MPNRFEWFKWFQRVSGFFWKGLTNVLLPRYCAVCDRELMDGEDCVCNACMFLIHPLEWEKIDDNPLLRLLWDRADVEAGACSLPYITSSDFHNVFVLTKYRGRPDVGRAITGKAFVYWQEKGLADGVDCIIPIPLHWLRRLKRGYNQAEWIAKGVADACNIPVKSNILYRTRYNRTQTHKNRFERREATYGIFVAKPGKGLEKKTVLLVDDVATTGSTIADAVRALKEAYPTVKVRAYTLGWSKES